jgi:hypothetical protein
MMEFRQTAFPKRDHGSSGVRVLLDMTFTATDLETQPDGEVTYNVVTSPDMESVRTWINCNREFLMSAETSDELDEDVDNFRAHAQITLEFVSMFHALRFCRDWPRHSRLDL